MNDNQALIIFDFDGTLVKESLHRYVGGGLWRRTNNLTEKKVYHLDEELTKKITIELTQEFLANKSSGWKNKEQLVLLFKNIISSGHKIAIASFNDYPDAIKYSLEQLLGEEAVKNIYIKSGLPAYKYEEIQLCNKVPYIEEIMRNTKITNKANVFFMDDDPKNVIAAKEFGIQAVLVEEDGIKYIREAFNFLSQFNKIDVKLEDPDTEHSSSDEDESYLEQDAMKKIGFYPMDKDCFSDTPWEGDNVSTLG
ncbi:MAG TPA: hypothetical protein LFW21_07345 [Rickettsia endosymbiont of Pyrocoelia pectoralis]|nr:hypothetical protein [Rickettsia endosymbiont of Pyrocoelia pectoralis]